jgi:plastocyanin
MLTSRQLILIASLVLTLPAMAAEPVTVTQKGLMFTPNELTLEKGQSVDFVNDDGTAHNVMVTGDGVTFNGGLQPPGGHVKYTFSKAGTFTAGCGIHPKMKLTITVN